jgi:hypothetical protein
MSYKVSIDGESWLTIFVFMIIVGLATGAMMESCCNKQVAIECIKAGKTWSDADGCK